MKKFFTLMVAALLVSGASFAGGDGKKCDKEKSCCKKEGKCSKDSKTAKDTKKTKSSKPATTKA